MRATGCTDSCAPRSRRPCSMRSPTAWRCCAGRRPTASRGGRRERMAERPSTTHHRLRCSRPCVETRWTTSPQGIATPRRQRIHSSNAWFISGRTISRSRSTRTARGCWRRRWSARRSGRTCSATSTTCCWRWKPIRACCCTWTMRLRWARTRCWCSASGDVRPGAATRAEGHAGSASTRTWRAKSSNCIRSASMAATRSRTWSNSLAPSPAGARRCRASGTTQRPPTCSAPARTNPARAPCWGAAMPRTARRRAARSCAISPCIRPPRATWRSSSRGTWCPMPRRLRWSNAWPPPTCAAEASWSRCMRR